MRGKCVGDYEGRAWSAVEAMAKGKHVMIVHMSHRRTASSILKASHVTLNKW